MRQKPLFIRLATGLLALLLLICAGACNRKTSLSEEAILAYYAELPLLMEKPETLSCYFLVWEDQVTLYYDGTLYSSYTAAGGSYALAEAHTDFAAWLRQSMPEAPIEQATKEGYTARRQVDYVCTLAFEEPYDGMSVFRFARGDKGHTVFWLTPEGSEQECVVCVNISKGEIRTLLSRYAPRDLTLGKVGGREPLDPDNIS